jgi:hypothetical protein
MKIPLLGWLIDERFLMHRLRSTSLGGLAGACVAGGLFEYRLLHDHVYSWDLLAVLAAMVVVKLGAMTWYRIND